MSRRKKAPENAEGSFSKMPHRVLDSKAYRELNFAAKVLLHELVRQLNGYNNGHLQLTTTWLRKRGWTSSDTISRATNELIESFLVVNTRQGGLNIGPSQFAVTWLAISNYQGLEMRPEQYPRGRWALRESLPPLKSKKPQVQLSERSIPTSGEDRLSIAPISGSKTEYFSNLTAPTSGNNVSIPSPDHTHEVASKRTVTTATLIDLYRK